MEKGLQSHNFLNFLQYLVLFLVICVSAILFSQTGDTLLRFLIIVANAAFYVFWGLWHHHKLRQFDKYITLEYSIVALLIVFLAGVGLGVIRFL